MSIQRTDDFEKRSLHLQNLSDEDLDSRFWELADKIVEPLIELAEKHESFDRAFSTFADGAGQFSGRGYRR